MLFEKLRTVLANFLFPPKCVFCGKLLKIKTEFPVCADCVEHLPYTQGKLCRICGTQIDAVYGADVCHNCRNTKRYFEKAMAPFFYDGGVRRAIIRLKFYGVVSGISVFSHYLSDFLTFIEPCDAITSVPLFYRRMKKRGYNQAALLAKGLADETGVPYVDMLVKIRDTSTQSRLNRKQRIENVRNAYEALNDKQLNGKSILLIDDVLTTGSTVNECAKVLKQHGAGKVFVLTLATSKIKG